MEIVFLDPAKAKRIQDAINGDPEFKLAARFMSQRIHLAVGDSDCILKIKDGVLDGILLSPNWEPSNFSIRGSSDAWWKMLQPVPPPRYNNISAGAHHDLFKIEGNLEAAYAHFGAVIRIIDIMRQLQNEQSPTYASVPKSNPTVESTAPARIESIVGKYVYIGIQGVEYRVYFEESGHGIPLVCQHTAGSDGRQWRFLLNDEEITSRYRVIAPDLPYHGKSLPPESLEWWKTEYKLTKSFLLDFYISFCKALALHNPTYIGCSMGGMLAPDLALEHPDLFRAVIGVEAGIGYGEKAKTQQTKVAFYHHPYIGNDYKGAAMFCSSAPTSPEKYRREISWEYSQGAPPVFKGDLNFHQVDHDMTDGSARRIDTSRCAVYLLTGEYDSGCSPEVTQLLANQIKGVKFTECKGLGHFAVCENFAAFKKYLMPVLDDIAYKIANINK